MQVSVLKEEGLVRELEVTIPAKDVEKVCELSLQDYGQKVKIDGFRPGKVPMAILKQKYGASIRGEAIERAVQENTQKALQDKGFKPAVQPKIELVDETVISDASKDLKYKVKLEVLPEFKVADLTALKLEKPVAGVDAKTIDDTLDRIAKGNRDFKKVEEDREAKKGDVVVVDFHGQTKEGKSVPGMSGHGMQVELGSGQLIPGFEDQLVGHKVGAHVHVDVTFPADYGMTELAGQPAIFHVDIKELREVGETKIDDELAKKLGFESLATLRDAVEKEISGDYAQFSKMKLKRALLDALDEAHDFELPPSMLEMEHKSIMMQMEQERKQKGDESPLSDDDKAELMQIAERRVRLGLVLAEVGRENNVQVSQGELRNAIMQEARRYPGQEQQVLEFYSKNPQIIESFRAPLYEDKVVEFIVGKASVTEKTVTLDELTAEDEEMPKAKKAGKKAAKK